MSDAVFADMHEGLFDVFARAGYVTRGTADPVPVRVVVDRGVVQTDDYGRVVRRVDIASFLAAEWQPQAGDRLTVDAWAKSVQTIEDDDSFIVKAVMHG